jgi:serine protease AprX
MARRVLTIIVGLVALCAAEAAAAGHGGDPKLDAALRERAHLPRGTSRVIVRTVDGQPADAILHALAARPGLRLRAVGAQVALVPDESLDALAEHPSVIAVSLDRSVVGTLERTAAAVGATWVVDELGVDGSGVGVAIIDSGVTNWHDDLAGRVVHFADFVNYQPLAYDDYGHGTHVAGIIAGSGHDSDGAKRGIAPGAHLVVLKVLDGAGGGYISNVIAAIDYAVQNRDTYNIRVLNVSVAAGVFESYNTDPLTLAAKRAVEAGIVVVTAAGNLGRNDVGQAQYGGITAPGNAPWVLTVGASSHMGTDDRADDTVASFSSRGPSYIDQVAKPDLVAPGVGIESLAEWGSFLFATRPSARVWGTVPTAAEPYMSLSGTSMAAPVVSGAVALMLQANPRLTPNAVKAILQYTAETRAGYNHLAQGAGFLNARGAVEFARTWSGTRDGDEFAADSFESAAWNRHIIWGNHRIGGGLLSAPANAWHTDVTWGASATPEGERVAWGVACDTKAGDCDAVIWALQCAADGSCQTSAPGANRAQNVVWGTACGGADCHDVVWGATGRKQVVWATACDGDSMPECAAPSWQPNALPPSIRWRHRHHRHVTTKGPGGF